MAVNPFEFVTAINTSKENLFETKGYTDSDYSSFLVNRALSYYTDTIFFANEANRILNNVPPRSQFDFYRFAITPRKRYSKWAKPPSNETVKLIMTYYNISLEKALSVMDLLSKDDIEKIKTCQETGGVKK